MCFLRYGIWSVALAGPGILESYKAAKSGDSSLLIVWLTVLIVIVLWYGAGFAMITREQNVIYLKRENQSPSFLFRNRDAILLAIFSAVIGGAVTLLLEKLLK
jgi:hypothetical protein